VEGGNINSKKRLSAFDRYFPDSVEIADTRDMEIEVFGLLWVALGVIDGRVTVVCVI
jgi:hypothetical protein